MQASLWFALSSRDRDNCRCFPALRELAVTDGEVDSESLARDGAMLCAVALSIWAETPSGPLALDESRVCIRNRTSSVVHSRSSGHES